MLKEIVLRIINECDNAIHRLEEEELNLKNCIDYLDIYKMRDEFKTSLIKLTEQEKKEEPKGEEEKNVINTNEK